MGYPSKIKELTKIINLVRAYGFEVDCFSDNIKIMIIYGLDTNLMGLTELLYEKVNQT